MEATIVYWGTIGIMEKKMEATGIIGIILRLYWGYIEIMQMKVEATKMGSDILLDSDRARYSLADSAFG